jgi:hypothetical protein
MMKKQERAGTESQTPPAVTQVWSPNKLTSEQQGIKHWSWEARAGTGELLGKGHTV